MGETGRRLAAALDELDERALTRERRILEGPQGPRVRIAGRELANFASNDYLSLAGNPRLREAAHRAIDTYGFGSGASPLVCGHSAAHEAAEQRFAGFVGLPRALLFSSGYAANLGILASLAQRDSEIFSDALNHACLIDGARLSRAQVTTYRHADLADLEAKLAASRAAERIVATDAVFSMDGDLAPLPHILELCERYDAWLVVDDAHGIGVMGARGRGSLEHFGLASPRIVLMATIGKALGGYGAFAAGEPDAIEWLLQRARTYIYSTALPPMAAAVAVEAMAIVESEPQRLATLRERIGELREALRGLGVDDTSPSAVHPLMLGANADALFASEALRERGFLVPAIRPPTVPQGTARLRISLAAGHTARDIEGLAAALAGCLAR
jgi:8-amino-7-oxononanoate synthase